MIQLDISERKLLNLIQTEFPLVGEPFAELGRRFGASPEGIIQRLAQLKEKGIIRQIGPVIDARSLGYHSTLAAMKVKNENIEKAEQVIAAQPGVSHGYERDNEFNVWFTLSLPPVMSVDAEIQKISQMVNAEIAFSLPVIKMFKIGAYFDMDEGGQRQPVAHHKSSFSSPVELSNRDRLIINEIQRDLPLTDTPFSAMAETTGMSVEEFLAGCRSLIDRGVIRRFSASINHRNAGFTANAMSCWAVPSGVDTLGQKLASLKEVSHCYERQTNPNWKYNLFAMIHGRSKDVCREIVKRISSEAGLNDYAMLYSTKEFKKTRVKYLV